MSRPRWTIASLMWLSFFVAIWLVATREAPEAPWLARSWFLLILGAIALHWTWFILVPWWSLELSGGDRDRQSRLLRCVINTPIPGGPRVRARFLLAANDQAAGRYTEAEAGFRSLLDDHREGMSLPPGFEALLANHLADTLDAMGRREEAIAVRERAAKAPEEDEETSVGLQDLGRLLDQQRRYAEAATAYERALALAPPDQRAVHGELMMLLALSTLNAGRPADALRWAEAVIESEPGGPRDPRARRLAVVACGSLGRLDDAERHARLGVELAPSPEQRAETLALLGEYMMLRGDLEQAERIAREAQAVLSDKKRLPWLVLAGIERERGRFAEAIGALEHARSIRIGETPDASRLMEAVIDQSLAMLHAVLGHRDVATKLIGRARPELADDPRLEPMVDAAAALVYALVNDRERALARIDCAEMGRLDVPEDGLTQRVVLSLLGWAALAVDEPGRAEAFLRDYLKLPPNPIDLPYTWYLLGDCRRRLGDVAGGRECDARAAATSFGTVWERRARERLAAEGATA